MTDIDGFVSPGFEPIAQEFEQCARSDEGAAALCVFHNGKLVTDLHAGPWSTGSATTVFSGSKGLVAACFIVLAARGLDLDTPVRHYWPELRAGKSGALTIGHVLSHSAGLPAWTSQELALDDLTDHELLRDLLEGQEPIAAPEKVIVYHPLTYGTLADELVRRVDGRSLASFFDDELARPLELDAWFGMPSDRAAGALRIEPSSDWATSWHLQSGVRNDPLANSIYHNPAAVWDVDGFAFWNSEGRSRSIPGAGAVASARAMAQLYSCLIDGREDVIDPAIARQARKSRGEGTSPVTGGPLAFAAGFALQTADLPFGPAADGFGHNGMGGSVHGAWPSRRLSFSFVPTTARVAMHDNRAPRLLAALWRLSHDLK